MLALQNLLVNAMPHYAGLNPRSWRLYKPAVHPRVLPGLCVCCQGSNTEKQRESACEGAERERRERECACTSKKAMVSGRKERGRMRQSGRARENERERIPSPRSHLERYLQRYE